MWGITGHEIFELPDNSRRTDWKTFLLPCDKSCNFAHILKKTGKNGENVGRNRLRFLL